MIYKRNPFSLLFRNLTKKKSGILKRKERSEKKTKRRGEKEERDVSLGLRWLASC